MLTKKTPKAAIFDEAAAYLMMAISATFAGMAARDSYVGVSVFFALKVIYTGLTKGKHEPS